ncbi:MAG: hypothetical protein ACRC8S_02885 [Fimbriiglobus sp.]
MIEYNCFNCKQKLLAPPDRAGKKTMCPKCLRPLVIPDPSEYFEEEIAEAPHNPVVDLEIAPYSEMHPEDDVLFDDAHAVTPEEPSSVFASPTSTPTNISHPPSRASVSSDSTIVREDQLPPSPKPRSSPQLPAGMPGSGRMVPPTPKTQRTSAPETMPEPRLEPRQDPRFEPTRRSGSVPSASATRSPAYAAAPSPGIGTMGSVASPTGTPAPMGMRTLPTRLPRHETGMVSLSPTGLANVDINAELTAALTMRMKPPPDPPADLALSTGGWLLLSATAVFFWLGGVFYSAWLLPFVAVIGALMLAFGYLWSGYLAGRNNVGRGFLTLMPPVTLWRIFHSFGDNGFRPLRFALTGALFIALYFVGYPARAVLGVINAKFDYQRPELVSERASMFARVKRCAEENLTSDLSVELGRLVMPEYRDEITPAEKPEFVAFLKELSVKGATADIRMRSITALLAWAPDEARGPVLNGLRTGGSSERQRCLELASRWPDAEMALAVAELTNSRSECASAKEALFKFPAEIAEAGLIPLLKTDNQSQILQLTDMLEQVGGEKSIAALQALSKSPDHLNLQDMFTQQIAAITKRLKATKPK